MARITVEDCLEKLNNRFALVQLASKRTKQILGGGRVVLKQPVSNKAVVTALREIADGQVRFMTEAEIEEARVRAAAERAAREAEIVQHQQQVQPQPLSPDSLFKTDLETSPLGGGELKNGDVPEVEAGSHGENGTGA